MASRMINAAYVIGRSNDPLEKECILYNVLSLMVSRYATRYNKTPQRLIRAEIRKSIEFLHSEYSTQINIKSIAQVAGLSEFHFMRVFQMMTGLSVHQYLTQIRLMRAKVLLSKGIAANQVAADVGFYDQSHLINKFRHHFGITPGEFAVASI